MVSRPRTSLMWLALVAALWASEDAPPHRPPGVAAVVERLQAQRYLDAHLMAQASSLQAASDTERIELLRLDSLALFRLDERVYARTLLERASHLAPSEAERLHLDTLIALSFLEDKDTQAFEARLARLPAEQQARLGLLAKPEAPTFASDLARLPLAPQLRMHIAGARQDYLDARATKSIPLAAVASALLPGAGQAYCGAWQSAALALVLNAVFITATVELATKDLPFSATAAGLAASFFYVGNIVNAAQLAQQANRARAEAPYEALERALIPAANP